MITQQVSTSLLDDSIYLPFLSSLPTVSTSTYLQTLAILKDSLSAQLLQANLQKRDNQSVKQKLRHNIKQIVRFMVTCQGKDNEVGQESFESAQSNIPAVDSSKIKLKNLEQQTKKWIEIRKLYVGLMEFLIQKATYKQNIEIIGYQIIRKMLNPEAKLYSFSLSNNNSAESSGQLNGVEMYSNIYKFTEHCYQKLLKNEVDIQTMTFLFDSIPQLFHYDYTLTHKFKWINKNFDKNLTNQLRTIEVIRKEFQKLATLRSEQERTQKAQLLMSMIRKSKLIYKIFNRQNHEQVINQAHGFLWGIFSFNQEPLKIKQIQCVIDLITDKNRHMRNLVLNTLNTLFRPESHNQLPLSITKDLLKIVSSLKIVFEDPTQEYFTLLKTLMIRTAFQSLTLQDQSQNDTFLAQIMQFLSGLILKLNDKELQQHVREIFYFLLKEQVSLNFNYEFLRLILIQGQKVNEDMLDLSSVYNILNPSPISSQRNITRQVALKAHQHKIIECLQKVNLPQLFTLKLKTSPTNTESVLVICLKIMTKIANTIIIPSKSLQEAITIILLQTSNCRVWLKEFCQCITQENTPRSKNYTTNNCCPFTDAITKFFEPEPELLRNSLKSLDQKGLQYLWRIIIFINLRVGKFRVNSRQQELTWVIKSKYKLVKPIGFDLIDILALNLKPQPVLYQILLRRQIQMVIQMSPSFQVQNQTQTQFLCSQSKFWTAYLQSQLAIAVTQQQNYSLIQKSLDLLQLFIKESQSKKFGKGIPHSCLLKGRKQLIFKIIYPNKKEKELIINQNQTLWKLKQSIVGLLIFQDASQVQIESENGRIHGRLNGQALKSIKGVSQGGRIVITKIDIQNILSQENLKRILYGTYFEKTEEIDISSNPILLLINKQYNADLQKWGQSVVKGSYSLQNLCQLFLDLHFIFPTLFNKILSSINSERLPLFSRTSMPLKSPRQLLAQNDFYFTNIHRALLRNPPHSQKLYRILQLIPTKQITIFQVYESLEDRFSQALNCPELLCYFCECLVYVIEKTYENFWNFYENSNFDKILQIFVKNVVQYPEARQNFYLCCLIPIFLRLINRVLLTLTFEKNERLVCFLENNDFSRLSSNYQASEFKQFIGRGQRQEGKHLTQIQKLVKGKMLRMMSKQRQQDYSKIILFKYQNARLFNFLWKKTLPLASSDSNLFILLSKFLSLQFLSKQDSQTYTTVLQSLTDRNSTVAQISGTLIYLYFICQPVQIQTKILNQLHNRIPQNNGVQILHFYEVFGKCVAFFFKYNSNNRSSIVSQLTQLCSDIFERMMKDQSLKNQNVGLSKIVHEDPDYKLQGHYRLINVVLDCSSQVARNISVLFLSYALENHLFPSVYSSHSNLGITNLQTRKHLYPMVLSLMRYDSNFNPNTFFYDIFNNFIISSANYNLNSKKTEPGLPTGLINHGNTCYLNSVIQALFSIKPFISVICASRNQDKCIKQLQKLFTNLQRSDVSWYDLGELFATFHVPIDPSQQQDSSEFLMTLLHRLQKIDPSIDRIIEYLFTGKTKSYYSCMHCKNSVAMVQQFKVYPIDIKGVNTLNKSLQKISEPQKITDYKCQSCSKLGCLKTTEINQAPLFLIINLQRVCYDYTLQKNIKIHHPLEFPYMLQFPGLGGKYPRQQEHKQLFELKSVIIHDGSGQGGHYYTHSKISNGRWVQLNDLKCKLMDQNQLLSKLWYGQPQQINLNNNFSKSATMLFYQKKVKPAIERLLVEDKMIQRCRYDEIPLFLHQPTLKEVQSQNNNLRLASLIYKQSDFAQFLISVIKLPKTQQKLQKIYCVLAKVLYVLQQIPEIRGVLEIQDTDYSSIYQLLVDYQQNNTALLFGQKPNLRILVADIICNVVREYSKSEQKRQFGNIFIQNLLKNNTPDFKDHPLKSQGYLKIISQIMKTYQPTFQLTSDLIKALAGSYPIASIDCTTPSITDTILRILTTFLQRFSSYSSSAMENEQDPLQKLILEQTSNPNLLFNAFLSIQNIKLFQNLIRIHLHRGRQPSAFIDCLFKVMQNESFLASDIVRQKCSDFIRLLFCYQECIHQHWRLFGTALPIVDPKDNRVCTLRQKKWGLLDQNNTLFGLIDNYLTKLNQESGASLNQEPHCEFLLKQQDKIVNLIQFVADLLDFIRCLPHDEKYRVMGMQLTKVQSPNYLCQNFIHYIGQTLNSLSLKMKGRTRFTSIKKCLQNINANLESLHVFPDESYIYGTILIQSEKVLQQIQTSQYSLKRSEFQSFYIPSKPIGTNNSTFIEFVDGQKLTLRKQFKDDERVTKFIIPIQAIKMDLQTEEDSLDKDKVDTKKGKNRVSMDQEHLRKGNYQQIQAQFLPSNKGQTNILEIQNMQSEFPQPRLTYNCQKLTIRPKTKGVSLVIKCKQGDRVNCQCPPEIVIKQLQNEENIWFLKQQPMEEWGEFNVLVQTLRTQAHIEPEPQIALQSQTNIQRNYNNTIVGPKQHTNSAVDQTTNCQMETD